MDALIADCILAGAVLALCIALFLYSVWVNRLIKERDCAETRASGFEFLAQYGLQKKPDSADFEEFFVTTVAYEEQMQAYHQYCTQNADAGAFPDFEQFFFEKDADGDYVLIGAREMFEAFILGATVFEGKMRSALS